MLRSNFLFALILTTAVSFTACDKDDPDIINEEELITTLTYTLTPTNGGSAITLSFQDLDGDGGDEPIIVGGTLQANTNYTGVLDLQNEAETPAESITEEVAEEADEHQFFFQTDISTLSVAYSDEDTNGNPIGLTTDLTTTAAASGSLTITLRHEPNKTADGVASGDITNAGGETDIEVTFPVDVE